MRDATPSSLQQELRQRRPFASAAEEAHLGVLRTAEVLGRGMVELLRPYGLTPTQYNVLRILRGAEPDGLPCSEIGARMLNHEPDVTRLLDRLHRAGWIERERAASDRRVVLTRITDDGRALLARLDGPVAEFHVLPPGTLDDDELRALVGLLDRLRQAATVRPCGAAVGRAGGAGTG